MESDLDVLGDGHALEHLDQLERPDQPHRGDLVLADVGDVLAGEIDRPGGRMQEAGQHIEERGLARPVGADHREQAAFRHRQVDFVVGDQSAEFLGQAAYVEESSRDQPSFSSLAAGFLPMTPSAESPFGTKINIRRSTAA